jgi:hypothetical protein
VSDLDETVAAAFDRPGSSAVQIRDVLRAAGRVSFTVADVERTLLSRPWQFRPDDADPPRWWPAPTGRWTDADPARRFTLYAWQRDALAAWRTV